MDEQATDQANKQPDEPEQEPTTEDILLENLSNDAIRFINKTMQGGHADSRHVNRSVVDVLDRTLKNAPPKEQKKNFSSSAFASPNDFYDYVTRTMIEAITDISTWLQDPTTKPFGTDFSTKNKFIGYGFKYQGKVPSIFEYKSRGCHIELSKKQRKDPTKPYTLDDIRLVTAYPITTEPDGQQQLKDLRPLIRQTPEYKNANPVRQAWLDYIGNQPSLAVLISENRKYLLTYFGQNNENLIVLGKKPTHYTLTSHDQTSDTSLLQKIREAGELPETQMSFPLSRDGTARDIMRATRPDVLETTDGLHAAIRTNLESKRKTQRKPKKTLTPLSKPENSTDENEQEHTAQNKAPTPQPAEEPGTKQRPDIPPQPQTQPTPGPTTSLEDAIKRQTAGLLSRGGTAVLNALNDGKQINDAQEAQKENPSGNKYDE